MSRKDFVPDSAKNFRDWSANYFDQATPQLTGLIGWDAARITELKDHLAPMRDAAQAVLDAHKALDEAVGALVKAKKDHRPPVRNEGSHFSTAKLAVIVHRPGELLLFGGAGTRISFWPNTFRALTLDTAGNVGIGTATPAFKLDVNGDVRGTRLILRRDGATTNAAVLCADAAVTNFVPYNTATSRVMNIIVRDASVRQLTITGGADLAEPFEMKDELEPGSVVVIDDEHPGRLKRSVGAYDTRVAGIVSGANGVSPGIALHQEGVMEGGQNVALTGRVYVQADATSAPIKPGDLLTTSEIPGHAMKVTNHAKAQGAVIGKAMSSLAEGTGMVLVLVTLQ